jgi:FlaA1/EpsC-like NDP-sugar epimerase
MISLDQGVRLVWHAFEDMMGGEIYVKKIPSIKITDIAKAIAPNAKHEIIGIRPGEKLHEQMISSEDSHATYEYSEYYKILPQIYNWSNDISRIGKGKKVLKNFVYSSENNSEWMTRLELKKWIKLNKDNLEKI